MRAGRFRGAHTLRSRGFHLDFAFPGIALIHAAFRATFQERPRFRRSCIKLDMMIDIIVDIIVDVIVDVIVSLFPRNIEELPSQIHSSQFIAHLTAPVCFSFPI